MTKFLALPIEMVNLN